MNNVVAIGALGGSGTRAVAEILMKMGYYFGDNLNKANDNRLFTALFKDISLIGNGRNEDEIKRRIDIFCNYMENDRLNPLDALRLLQIAHTNPNFNKKKLPPKLLFNKVFNYSHKKTYWGWKEPHTSFYIKELNQYIPNFKYIHVLRHGLDMAFSKNKNQLKKWGSLYGLQIEPTDGFAEIAFKQLEFWIKTTKEAIENSLQLKEKFLLLNYDLFCADPQNSITKIIELVDVPFNDMLMQDLMMIPQKQPTSGRFADFDLGIFDNRQLDYVKSLGYLI